jgi:16S rRNA (adenine1518-N6/adenine1519-N6)-dimethyltransferase
VRQPLGQHFLKDQTVIRTIVAAAELQKTETALEIGPGKGVLTQALFDRVQRLVAIELDRSLAAQLTARWGNRPGFEVVQGDFLKQDLDALFPGPAPVKCLGNLPYSITSPIFEKLLAWPRWDTGVFLIQKEVAERMVSGPGSRTFGLLSLAVQLFAAGEIVMNVKPGAFSPPPEVMSSVIRLRRKTQSGLSAEETQAFFDLARGAFAHRRKTLANSLALATTIPKEKIEDFLRFQQISPAARAETLGLSEYARLAAPWSIFRRETKFDFPKDNVYNTSRLKKF